MELLKDIVSFMLDKGIKGVAIVLLLVSSIAIFISPSFTFIYLYKRTFLNVDTLNATIIILLIIDSIIFISLLVGSLIIPPFIYGIKNNCKLISEEESAIMFYESVFISIALMGLISTIQLISYYIKYFLNLESDFKYGVNVLLVTLVCIIITLGSIWIIIACKKRKHKSEYETILDNYKNGAN